MKRPLLTTILLLSITVVSGRHYDMAARHMTTADGLPSNTVIRIWQDEAGYLWFDTRNGLCRYDGYVCLPFDRGAVEVPSLPKQLKTRDALWKREGLGKLARLGNDGSVSSWQLIPPEVIAYTRNDHFQVADVDERTEAITTYGNGLFLYDKPTGEMTRLSKDDGWGAIDDNYLTGLFVDRTGCIWVIEDYLGVKCLQLNQLHYIPLWLEKDASLPDVNNIRCIAPTNGEGLLTVSNQTGDLYECNTATGSFSLMSHNNYRVYTMLRDRRGRLWTGTRGNGLWCDGRKIEGLPSLHIFNLREDGKGCLLVSMLEGGVARLHEDGNRDMILPGYHVHDASQRGDGLWVAAEKGLFLIGPRGAVVDSVQGCFVCLHTAGDGRLWAGSTDRGLVGVRRRGNSIMATYYNSKNGLANNSVLALTEDRQGRLWMGTEDGISRLTPATGDVVNYRITDRRRANVFSERSAVSLPDGRLFFGSQDGIIEVYPDDEPATPPPTTTITGLLVNGERMETDSRLTYQQNNLTVLYSNFQYAKRQGVRYQYRLEGVDADWCLPTSEHMAVYRNLPPGRYTFHVRSTAGVGMWGEESVLALHIHEPWWNTWWAWLAYLLLAGGFGLVVAVTLQRLARLHRSLEVEQRVSAFKQDFYNRLERELRNPVNVLQGATENVQLSGTTKTTVQSLRRGSRRVLKLMDMIRQFHQLGEMEMQVRAEQDSQNAEAERRFREIRDAIHAEEKELKELAPPPINDKTLLIVEEDEDNLTHLTDTLSPYFKTMGCQSLTDFEEMFSDMLPDLVIMDLVIDERRVCELTSGLQASYPALPVIHLSPFDDDAHQLRSLRAGAADYIVKPFSGRVLVERVTNALGRSRQRARDVHAESSTPTSLLTEVKDRKFIDQLHAVLNSHVTDVNFSVQQWAQLMNLGRTQFYKRVKELTGESPVVLLHRARLDYAARLLRQSQSTVEDVMLQAGFRNATHFYNAFRRQFGMSPRDYRLASR